MMAIIYFRKEIIRDYVASVFNGSPSSCVKISRDNDMGRYIYSLIKFSDLPVKKRDPLFPYELSINIPKVYFPLESQGFCYFSNDDMLKINDYALADFNQQFRAFSLMGWELGIMQKTTCELFLASFSLNPDKHSGLVKKDYRFRSNLKHNIIKLSKSLGFQ